MQVRNSESHVVFVYTWNPDWQTFKNKSLEDKIEAFESIVREAATDFENKSAIDQNSISLVIAPENIFSPSSCQGGQEAYSAKEHQLFQDKLQALSHNVSERVLIISGAICYFSADLDSYKITSYLISKNRMDSYDKKKSTGPIRSGDRVVPMTEGKSREFSNLMGYALDLKSAWIMKSVSCERKPATTPFIYMC